MVMRYKINGVYWKQFDDVCGEFKVVVWLANTFEYFNIMGSLGKCHVKNQYIISGNSNLYHSNMKIIE